MSNLLEETLKELKDNNKSPSDVMWCGSEEFGYFKWKDFETIASWTNYDGGYGGQEIAKDLLIVGKRFWLERHEYDGSEWWEYKTLPQKPKTKTKPVRFTSDDSWSSLLEMHQPVGKYDNLT